MIYRNRLALFKLLQEILFVFYGSLHFFQEASTSKNVFMPEYSVGV